METTQRRSRCLVVPDMLAVLIASAVSAGASPEPVYFAGTGHYYQVIDPTDGTGWHVGDDIEWLDAYGSAYSRRHMGVRGRLATITSQAENEFVLALLDPQRHYWIGGWQAGPCAEPGGDWEWITGEPWGFSNWAPGAPDNQPFQHAQLKMGTPNPGWSGWLTGGDGQGHDGSFDVQLGSEPRIGPVSFEDGRQYRMDEAWDMINEASQVASNYNAALLSYYSAVNLYYLELVPKADGVVGVDFNAWGQVQVGFEEDGWTSQILDEDVLEICGGSGEWDDAPEIARQRWYVVEYPVVEPTGLLLWAWALVAVTRRRGQAYRPAQSGPWRSAR